MPNIEFGIALPQACTKAPVNRALLNQFCQKADASSFHSLWVQEVIGASQLEAVSLLTYASAVTQNIRLGSAVLLTALRVPFQLAKVLSSLDQLSGGRLIIGVGLGSDTGVYPAFGLSPERRLRRFLEGIALIKRLWTEEEVSHAGDFWQFENKSCEPKPLQKPYPPIWFGGSHPNALRRAVELGTGWIGGRTPTEKFKSHVTILRKILAEKDRDPASFMIGKRVFVVVDASKRRAEQSLEEWFANVYGSGGTASVVSVYGNQQECIDKIGEIVEAGAKLLILNPIADHIEQLDCLAQDILPKFSTSVRS
jgi:alkanesulfonate monooxygenase SsuD/methylene tetrahydromethanopterin reductase-like flavin-dependent oxidoreductase (luciferase family)